MADELIEKRLPFSMPAEQSLLGAVLIDPASLNEIAALMKGEDFYLEEHKQIYLAMQELFLTNREIDVVTLIDMLVTRGVYDKARAEHQRLRAHCQGKEHPAPAHRRGG